MSHPENSSPQATLSSEEILSPSKFARQIDLFNPYSSKQQVPVVMGGAGSVGSWTALSLAKMGVELICVYDFDAVESPNLSNQLYNIEGVLKLTALEYLTKSLSGTGIIPRNLKLPEGFNECPFKEFIYISAVDTMKDRSAIWSWILGNRNKVKYYLDARMGGNIARVIAVDPNNLEHAKYYGSTLYSDDSSKIENKEARELADLPCTGRSIVYTAMQCATLLTANVRNYLVTGDAIAVDSMIDLGYMNLISINPLSEPLSNEEDDERPHDEPSGAGTEEGSDTITMPVDTSQNQ